MWNTNRDDRAGSSDGRPQCYYPAEPSSYHPYEAGNMSVNSGHANGTFYGYGNGYWSARQEQHNPYVDHSANHLSSGVNNHYYCKSRWPVYEIGARYPPTIQEAEPSAYDYPFSTQTQWTPAGHTFSSKWEPDSADTDELSSSASTTGAKKRYGETKRPGVKKRFAWTETLHGHFVNAIFRAGLKNATPEDLVEVMESLPCQKRQRAIDNVCYTLNKYQAKDEEMKTIVQKVENASHVNKKRRLHVQPAIEKDLIEPVKYCYLSLPALTEAERISGIGASLLALLDLLRSLEESLLRRREDSKTVCAESTTSQQSTLPVNSSAHIETREESLLHVASPSPFPSDLHAVNESEIRTSNGGNADEHIFVYLKSL